MVNSELIHSEWDHPSLKVELLRFPICCPLLSTMSLVIYQLFIKSSITNFTRYLHSFPLIVINFWVFTFMVNKLIALIRSPHVHKAISLVIN